MLKIAITGNIASGKSAVQKVIEDMGYSVFCADECAHKILESSNDVKKLFGTNDRAQIAKTVFLDPDKLKKLENIIHPIVKCELESYFLQNSAHEAVFAAVPQLFEAGFEPLFDKIIFVDCPYEIRLLRLIKNRGYDENYAKLRMDSQMAPQDKIQLCDIVIQNDGTLDELKDKTIEALKLLGLTCRP